MIIIDATAAIAPELRQQLGDILVCMLPVGNKTLLQHQIEALAPSEAIVLAIPADYEPTLLEKTLWRELSLSIIALDQSRCLPQSMRALNDLGVIKGAVVVRPAQHDCLMDAKRQQLFRRYGALQRLPESTVCAAHEGKIIAPILDGRTVAAYYQTRAQITTERAFNTLVIHANKVTKSSQNHHKIQAETHWFQALPAPLLPFTPAFLGRSFNQVTHAPAYTLEYLDLLPLNEIFVYGHQGAEFWSAVFQSVDDYLERSRSMNLSGAQQEKIAAFSHSLYVDKTQRRLAAYAAAHDFALDAPIFYAGAPLGSVNEIVSACWKAVQALPIVPALLHGDLCFSNLFFDPASGRIKVIDPRGLNEQNELTVLGDQTYDLAKLAHSVIGLYDFIIAGCYELLSSEKNYRIHFPVDPNIEAIQARLLTQRRLGGLTMADVMPAVVLLFLSMPPLHKDRPDRQQAMLANAFRLYHQFVR